MKKCIFLVTIGIFFSFFAKASEIQFRKLENRVDTLPTDSLIIFLQQLNIESFYGVPVDSFLNSVPAIPYGAKVYSSINSMGKLYQAQYLGLHYSGRLYVNIHVREYTHMSRYSTTFNWDVNLFRQEKIYKIDIIKEPEGICINGWCRE